MKQIKAYTFTFEELELLLQKETKNPTIRLFEHYGRKWLYACTIDTRTRLDTFEINEYLTHALNLPNAEHVILGENEILVYENQ